MRKRYFLVQEMVPAWVMVLVVVLLLVLLLGTTVIADAQTEPNKLILITEPEPAVSFSERVPIQVRYVNPEDTPIPDEFVAFEPQGDTGGTTISARNALTNQDGVAETYIEAGIQELDFDVKISVPGDDTVQPLTVRVRIQPRETSDYLIKVNYGGAQTLNRVEVLIFDTDRACSTLDEDPSDPPSEDIAWTSLVIVPDADGNIPDRGLNVPTELELQYAVARATAELGSGLGTDYFVTFGCDDDIEAPDPTHLTVIEITMSDLHTEALDDYFSMVEDTQLKVPPSGVLANDDESPDPSTPMLANLEDGPNHGTVKLSSNGGFNYVPDRDYCGDDEFRYYASNGFLESNIATVFINVKCVHDPTIPKAEKLMMDDNDWDNQWEFIDDPYSEVGKYHLEVKMLVHHGIANAANNNGKSTIDVFADGLEINDHDWVTNPLEVNDQDWDRESSFVSVTGILEWNGDDDGSDLIDGISITLVGPGGKAIGSTATERIDGGLFVFGDHYQACSPDEFCPAP